MVGMGRPPLPLGTYGDISVSPVPKGGYKARARYRDRTGRLRTMARFADTKGRARGKLREALAEWQQTGQPVQPATTITTLADRWLEAIDASDRATNTREVYRYAVDRYVKPHLGPTRLAEASTSVCDAALVAISKEKGKGAAKTARSVLNGMFGLAVRHDALTVNPIHDTQPISSSGRAQSRALTDDERAALTDWLRTDPRAVLMDLPDLVEFGLASGCRIGEALALRESVLDLEAGTVEVNATAIRVKSVGMVIQERPKTAAGWRVLALPAFAVDMLKRRLEEVRFNPPTVAMLGSDGLRQESPQVLFPAPLSRALRDTSNTARELREALDRAGYDWVTFHTFRKTVATRLDAAGHTSRQIADHLGHARPSFTQDVYMGRHVANAAAADVLDR